MLTSRTVVTNPHVTVREVACTQHGAHWSPVEVATATHIVLVRRGRFRLDSQGRRVTVDPTTGYLEVPGREARFAHPAGGDVCTSIAVPSATLTDGHEVRGPAVRVDARLELAHRVLLRGADDPDFTAVEAVLTLLRLACRRASDDDGPAPGRHLLADRAREAILADDPAATSLVTLAGALRVSPSHLSRTFRHHAGMSVSRYRNRIRVSRALARLADGEVDLADLAVTVGFSDQAHLTRTLRREVGATPRHLRTLLGGDVPAGAP